MVTLTGTIGLPTRREAREIVSDALKRTPVLITAILCATFVVTIFVGSIVYLVYAGKSTEALTGAVIAPLIAILATMGSRLRRVEDKVTQVVDGGP